jgi:hypothetical protein
MTDAQARLTLADWLNAFKADPFSTGADKVDRLLELVRTPDAQPSSTDEVERVDARVGMFIEILFAMVRGRFAGPSLKTPTIAIASASGLANARQKRLAAASSVTPAPQSLQW